jgi:hypothetical protein
MVSFYIRFYEQTKHILRVMVDVHGSHLCVWKISLLTGPLQYQHLGWTLRGIGLSSHLLPDRLADQHHEAVRQRL